MELDFIDNRLNSNLLPLKINNKEKILFDLYNLEESISGRMDVMNICNAFIFESVQQLINSINLFEMGYFDCAYYALRSSVDISTTMVFLSDLSEDERTTYYNDWIMAGNFPLQVQMLRKLFEDGNIFSNIKNQMSAFLTNAKQLSYELNKYVHKQGFSHFYAYRRQIKSSEAVISTFEYYLKKCIGIVAVMRLVIDPFPILLMDDEILYRYSDSLTYAYSQDFVDEYIGDDNVEAYKKTDIYLETYIDIMNEEKKNEATFNVAKNQYIDTNKFDDIFSQISLLNSYDIISVLFANFFEKAVKIYWLDGVLLYFTNRKSNRNSTSFSSLIFKEFSASETPFNQPYDNVYISVFHFKNNDLYVEHNEPLTEEEIDNAINRILTKMEELQIESK